MFKHILLASHGTAGALAAESKAMSLCATGGIIHHLIVVPSFWRGMLGDDWLNNGSTRDNFYRYLENELGSEVTSHCDRVSKNAGMHNLRYSKSVVIGEPANVLLAVSQHKPFDLIIIGSPRPKGVKGLRSKMFTDKLVHALLHIPLLIVPYPQQTDEARSV